MSVHKISVKQLISRIHQIFPAVPENYVLNLVNDALVEIGMHSTKPVQSKDSSGNNLEANKVYRVDLMDEDGDYIQIPRLIDKNILLMDADSSESALTTPDDR